MQGALDEVIFKNLGVPWPHIVASFLPLQSEASKECRSCQDWSQGLFQSPFPGIFGVLKSELEEVLAQTQDLKLNQSQNPWSAGGTA